MIRLSVPSIGDEEIKAVERVLRSGQLVHGKECELFERELAEYLGCKDVVVVSSGTAALHLALIALDIGPGDAVLVPDFTFPATANVVELVGAKPVFVDVEMDTYNISVAGIERVLENWQGPETIKAIMPVHEFGCPADMQLIMALAKRYKLLVIEDAACALGAVFNKKMIGTFGHCGCFSFHPRKSLTTGEGGAIVTNDKEMAERLRILRNHGIKSSNAEYDFVLPGFNYRMTNIQAALGRVQLGHLESWLKARYKLQQVYRAELKETNYILPARIDGHAWQTFMLVLPEKLIRNKVMNVLKDKGIETNLGAYAIHCLKYYKERRKENFQYLHNNCAERLFKRGLAIPLSQQYSLQDIYYVSGELRKLSYQYGGEDIH